MSEEKGLAKRKDISFVSEALQTLDGAKEWAKGYLDSGLAPGHYYKKKADGKPDYKEGNVGGLLAVVAHGHDVGMSVSQAIQQIVPINGLTCIKGDGAKALVLASTKCADWKEEVTGSVANGDYRVTITSTRIKPNQTVSHSFSVDEAKRAGLWVTQDKLQKKPGLRYSTWYTYPERMIKYRALGFHARDVYPDVMQGLVTEEEAMDYPPEGTTVIETPRGATIHVDPTDATEAKSESLTGQLAAKLAGKELHIQEQEQLVDLQGAQHVYTEEELKAMGQGIFSKVKKEFPELNDLLEKLPGKRTRDKWRKGVLVWQEEDRDRPAGMILSDMFKKEEEPEVDKPADQLAFEDNIETTEASGVVHEGVHIDYLPQTGTRDFDSKRKVFVGLGKLGLTPEKYSKVAGELVDEQSGETYLSKYENMDQLSKRGTVEHVMELINVFLSVNS
jgi:hypothetical protein